MNRVSSIIDPSSGKPFVHANGKPRPELMDAFMDTATRPRRANMTYDAARDSTEYQAHWANSDGLDADASNSREVRHKLMRRSRHEAGSNGYYDGIMETHANMVVGVGPKLRMLTGNRNFNQRIEYDFWEWSQRVELRRKVWCMAHARTQDGEGMGMLLNNPALPGIQLDITLIEGEQCQTPLLWPPDDVGGYIDGIRYDQYDNILWYDVLPRHPGAANQWALMQRPVRVAPSQMLHWFKMKRPGGHRGVPAMTSTLNVGASSRRFREATLAAAETAADLNVMLTTQLNPEVATDPMAPFSSMPMQKRMMTAAPMGWEAHHFKSEHPSATYAEFHRTHISEQARPISMPYNAAACDSSTYSFASGKLDTLCYRAAIDVERQDCSELVLDKIFRQWLTEWSLLHDRIRVPFDHQWDWPKHPVIDDVADATAKRMRLEDGTLSYRQAFSDEGMDLEDELRVQAEDVFGVANNETIAKCRQMMILRTAPQHALPYMAQLMGLSAPTTPANDPEESFA